MHWFDVLSDEAFDSVRDRTHVVVNGGLSVSGLQHVGRLRGEIVLAHNLVRALRAEDKDSSQSLVMYTQDAWRGKASQVAAFPQDEGKRFVGWRLIDVPDPQRCHGSWVDHYWDDFGSVLDRFAPDVRTVTTTELYRRTEMKDVVRDLASRAPEVREVVNRYRTRLPYPRGWTPFEAHCESCNRIGATTLAIEGDLARYRCDCGGEGTSPLERGKLNWRLEWPALWKVLDVGVEPFGKDHASPGGSRDSCKEIARTILGFEPPFGIPYEWVGLAVGGKDRGDMTSSGFLGFTPKQWLPLADPEVLRYVYTFHPIFRRIVLDLSKMDAVHDAYDHAERLYYAETRTQDEDHQARSYELALLGPAPESPPFQLSYRHAAILSQVAPDGDRLAWSLRRMRETRVLQRELADGERGRVARRLAQSRAWVEGYAPENRIAILEELPDDVRRKLEPSDRTALELLAGALEDSEWQEAAIREAMVSLTRGGSLPVETGRLFRDTYLVLLGQDRGPRAAPLLAALDRTFVLRRLREASG